MFLLGSLGPSPAYVDHDHVTVLVDVACYMIRLDGSGFLVEITILGRSRGPSGPDLAIPILQRMNKKKFYLDLNQQESDVRYWWCLLACGTRI